MELDHQSALISSSLQVLLSRGGKCYTNNKHDTAAVDDIGRPDDPMILANPTTYGPRFPFTVITFDQSVDCWRLFLYLVACSLFV